MDKMEKNGVIFQRKPLMDDLDISYFERSIS